MNKKLFPDLSPAASGAPLGSRSKTMEGTTTPAVPRFSMASSFWDTIDRDPEVKAEFERRIEARAKHIIDSESGPQKEALFETARQQGKELGLSEAKAEADKLFRDLKQITEITLQEKQALLFAHQRAWCEALVHLSRRFLMPLNAERLVGLHAWLEESIGDLTRQGKIRLVVAPAVFARLKTVGLPEGQWEWNEDRSLSEFQVRVELVGGGILFDPAAESQKLSDKMSEILGIDASSDTKI